MLWNATLPLWIQIPTILASIYFVFYFPQCRFLVNFLCWFNADFMTFLLSVSLCKGRTLYSVVRDAKVVLDVNKTRQIAQEMVKVKKNKINVDSQEHFSSKHRIAELSPISLPLLLREWATSTLRGFYTKTWSPRMCFMITAKSSSLTLDFLPYLEFCRLAGKYF